MSFVKTRSTSPGTISFHEMPVGQTPAGDLTVPLAIFRGKRPGPTVGIISGVHAGEYNGPVSCLTMCREINPEDISGTILMVPMLNTRSFEVRMPFRNTLDYVNINRVFPGNPYGSISERMAHVITTEIALASDAFFDLHSGDLIEEIPLHSGCKLTGNQSVDAQSEKFARLFDTGLVNIMGSEIDRTEATNTDEGTYFAGLDSSLTSVGSAALAGIPSMLMEAGGAGSVDRDVVRMNVNGFRNVFKYLDMLPGAPNENLSHDVCYGMYILRSIHGGFFMPEVAIGDRVTEGQSIGEMWNWKGETTARFTAPMSGVVLMMFTTPVRVSGETLLIFGKME